ncbi:AAA domain-containing protein [Flammula alnicola]|nr:AAA domain-containing protein [Flammula alnicola]
MASNAMQVDDLNLLVQGLDDDFWSAVPSPDPSPVKPKPPSSSITPRTPPKFPIALPSRTAQLPSVLSSTVFSAPDHDIASFLEGSEHWNLDDDPFSPVKPSVPKFSIPSRTQLSPPTPQYVPDPCTRCVVESVTDEYVDNRWRKAVSARVESSNERVDVYLYDDWYQTDIRIDDIFNVLGTFSGPSSLSPSTLSPASAAPSAKRHISITSPTNMLILHPDLLLTATALSNAPQCRRKPLLAALVRSTSDTTPALVYGSILHEVMQRCLREGMWDAGFVDGCIGDAVQAGLGELVKLGVGEEVARREVSERARGMGVFAEKYLAEEPKANAVLTNTRSGQHDRPSLLAITKLLDIEEDIWSPTYGLKGKLDATVQGIIADPVPSSSSPSMNNTTSYQRPSAPTQSQRTQTCTPLPLELKTGRALAGMEHRAQTMLYTLLLSERYGADVRDGLLFYTQGAEGEVVRVPRGRNEIRALVGVRNEMAGVMWRRVKMEGGGGGGGGEETREDEEEDEEPFLPPPIDDERACKRCYVLDTCLLFRKTHPNHSLRATYDPPIPPFLSSTFEMRTGHLTPVQTAFFRRWEGLLALEERDLVRFRRELWTLGARERERRGRCFGGMVLRGDAEQERGEQREWGKEGKIHRYTYAFVRSRSWPQLQIQNLLNGHLNVGDPITVSVEPHMLALARGYILRLTPGEVVLGVDHVLDVGVLRERVRARSGQAGEELIFRIDKDELFGGMARVRNNLAQMFYADGDRRRLELVVDLRKPVFCAPGRLLSSLSTHLHLNPSQLSAMEKVLSAQDYALILGMPGTGKTTVIAALIRELVRRGKTVLLSSYTHSAVDTILMKLVGGKGKADFGVGFGILRLGNVDKVHPDVRKYTLDARRTAMTVEQLEVQVMAPPVVATTCLSIEQYVECLVKNPEARKGGLDVSLFRRLSEAHPEAVVDLRFQYRMNEDIMLLSNRLIYSDRLRCGNEAVAKASLVLGDRGFLGRLHRGGGGDHDGCGEQCWLERLVDERCRAVFVDTDALPAPDSRVGDLVQNTTEAELVRQFTETLLQCGVQESQIGIISLYRQQVKLLQHLLVERKGVEVLTADKSQGRDKDCIIISLVRSNEAGQVGDLVKDWRRMNVSFTRARKKLVIIGSRKTLQREPLLVQFFELMQEQGWIVPLPPAAHLMHASVFGVCTTPAKRGVDADRDGDLEHEKETEMEEEKGGLSKVVRRAVVPLKLGKENGVVNGSRPMKKLKVTPDGGKVGGGMGVLKGRPILRDLMGND